jgi:hypothetical protein
VLTPGEDPGFCQQGKQQPVAQVAGPLARSLVEYGARIQDGLDLTRQKQRRAVTLATAPDPHQHRRARRGPGIQVRQQSPGRPAARRPAHQPSRDRHPMHRLLPAVEGDQRRQARFQGLG